MMATDTTTIDIPEQGQLVQVRQRRYVVTDVVGSTLPAFPLADDGKPQHLATLASVEDDALGEELQVIWELEPGARVYDAMALPAPAGFEQRRLDSFSNTVRWGAVPSATETAERAVEPVRKLLKFERNLQVQARIERLHDQLQESQQSLHLSPANVQAVVEIALELVEPEYVQLELCSPSKWEQYSRNVAACRPAAPTFPGGGDVSGVGEV